MPDLNPIRALLYALDKKAGISVVTATTRLSGFDLEKIARYVEEIPDLPMGVVVDLLKTFSMGCHEEKPYINANALGPGFMWDTMSYDVARAFRVGKLLTLEGVVAHLGAKGRPLKQGLRLCYDKWQSLRGEIDFDDLLVMSLLKVSKPKLFEIVADNFSIFRNDEAKADEAIENIFLTLGISDVDKEILSIIRMEVLRPKQGDLKLQGLGREEYWLRFLREPILNDRQRDQPILKAISENDEKELVEAIMDFETQSDFVSSRSLKVLSFEKLISVRTVEALFKGVVMGLRNAQWSSEVAPGILTIYQLIRRKFDGGELGSVRELIEEGLDLAVPSNLTLAADLRKYFLDEDARMFGEKDRLSLERHLNKLLIKNFVSSPQKLVDALRVSKSAELLWICVGLARIRAKDFSMKHFKGWPKFAETILTAARLSPEVMLPQLAWFVVSERPFQPWTGRRAPEYYFDSSLAKLLFGGANTVLKLLSSLKAVDYQGPQVKALFEALGHNEQ